MPKLHKHESSYDEINNDSLRSALSHTHESSYGDIKVIMNEFLPIFVYLLISGGLASLIVGLSFVFTRRQFDPEKVGAYECGFDPFDDARSRFDIQFYLVCILFIIFDLEISYLFPWSLTLVETGFFGFVSMMVFLFILTVGFIYEWYKGALDWE